MFRALVLVVLLTGCASVGVVQQPPQRFQRDATPLVKFATDPKQACEELGVEAAIPGSKVVACTSVDGMIVMPNPCVWPVLDGYAKVMCHELGHANGWKH